MLKFDDNLKQQLIDLSDEKGILLEGNIVKMIDHDGNIEFEEYLNNCILKDRENRRRRLEITKQVQNQNKVLSDLNDENQKIMLELQNTLKEMEDSKKQIEEQNDELIEWKEKNEKTSLELKEEMVKSETARIEAENAKKVAESDLDMLQRKMQTQLMGKIVKVALWIIIGVGVSTTLLYLFSIFTNKDTQMIGSTWSNLFGILLTNAFSIIGTIMGVKYASEKENT